MTDDPSRTECFVYFLTPGSETLYDQHHAAVWPEVVRSLRAGGILDYSIFRRGNVVISVVRRGPQRSSPPAGDEGRVSEWTSLLAPLFEATTDQDGNALAAHRIFDLSDYDETGWRA